MATKYQGRQDYVGFDFILVHIKSKKITRERWKTVWSEYMGQVLNEYNK